MPRKPKRGCAYPGCPKLTDGQYCEEHKKLVDSQYNNPTSKPLDLLGYPICNSSKENAVVIDTFGGSGSTLMACEQLNRICCMMETG